MTLAEITTPFERKRVIEYSRRDYNKVVRHWVEVQRVIGPLWKTQNVPDKYGELEFSLYLFFDKSKDGLRYENRMKHPEFYTTENYAVSMKKYGIDTYEHFIRSINRLMENDMHIDMATIEYVRQFDPDKADIYAKHRQERMLRKEMEHQERARAREAQRALEKKRREEQQAAERAKYMGWVDPMTPMQFGKVDATLNKLIRLGGKTITKRKFVIACVQTGLEPRKKENIVTSYRGNLSKPKTEYRLFDRRDNTYYIINKTEYDFALFLYEKRRGMKDSGENGGESDVLL